MKIKKNVKEFGDYYLGLDIGTSSVGWALTDENYNILKFKRKSMWGVRLFDEANTAAERRVYRSTARRLQRRKQRIKLLQEIFSDEVSKIDNSFFIRLEESMFHTEDKKIDGKFSLFNDGDFNDLDYYKDYPTIYHLRYALMNENKKFDIRLVYLALHHIIKKRGHFLFQGQSIEEARDIKNIYSELKSLLAEEYENDFLPDINNKNISDFSDIMSNGKISIKEKEKLLTEFVGGISKTEKQRLAVIRILSGQVTALQELLCVDYELEIEKIDFKSNTFDQDIDKIIDNIGSEKAQLILVLKSVYDWATLSIILDGESSISKAKVKSYEEHGNDLKILKKIVKKYDFNNTQYDFIFSNKSNSIKSSEIHKQATYENYIYNKCSHEEFCKCITKILTEIKKVNKHVEDEDLDYLLNKSTNFQLLLKQVNVSNGSVPYQIHLLELKKILENSKEHYNFLETKDDSGYTNIEKIIKIFEFKIPYYVGPLNDYHKDNEKSCTNSQSWVVKKDPSYETKNKSVKIRPWNFHDVVDLEASAEVFIKRMTNKCTYLKTSDVIPKNSLTYSKYMVLNELNNIRVNSEPLSVEAKQSVYNDLYLKLKKVTIKRLRTYLINLGFINSDAVIGGLSEDIEANMASYIDFLSVLKFDSLEDISTYDMVEEIIKSIVIFGDDKNMLQNRVEKQFGNILNKDQIKRIKTLKYTGWGRFSNEFLKSTFGVNKNTGVKCNILSALFESQDNLQQLLSDRYTFIDEINNINAKDEIFTNKISYDMLDNLYVSPSVKRAIWQTLKIVDEIVKVTGRNPKKVFIEVARDVDKKEELKKIDSRRKQLMDLYRKIKSEDREWVKELDARKDSDLRSKKLYLYYTQMGRCMYSDTEISLDALLNNHQLYDIDHIYPRSKTKDDSFDNLVLVKSELNRDKTDKYPLETSIQSKCKSLWQRLYDAKLISKNKYGRLIRTSELTTDELANFINRQLVEVRQSSKAVIEILKNVYNDSDIVYSKAGNVSDFRQNFELVKVRELNDYHHAKDAYLNIVVGNIFDVKFTKNPLNYVKEAKHRSYSLKPEVLYSDKNDISNSNIIAWRATGENKTIDIVRKYISRNDILFTRQALQGKGKMFDLKIVKKGEAQYPIKEGDERLLDFDKKYGGYNSAKIAYFVVVELSNIANNSKERRIEAIPIHIAKKIECGNMDLSLYLSEIFQDSSIKIIYKNIKANMFLKIDGLSVHLSAKNGDTLTFKNAVQLFLDECNEQYCKKIMNVAKKQINSGNEYIIYEPIDKVDKNKNEELFLILLKKLEKKPYIIKLSAQYKKISDKLDDFNDLSIEKQCIFLSKLLTLFNCSGRSTDLSLLGGAKAAGIITNNASFKSAKNTEIKLIHQSPTGLFEQTIDLLTYEPTEDI